MQSATHKASVSKKSLWGGRIISAVMVLFLLFDSGMKVLKLAPAMEGTIQLISRKVGFCDWNRRSSALSSMSFLALRFSVPRS